MLSFTSSLSSNSEAFAIFVNDKLHFKDRKNFCLKEVRKKINSFLSNH